VQSIDIASHASPDGYTLLVQGSGIWLMPFMRKNVTWDPLKDLAPIKETGTHHSGGADPCGLK
jgi:hypothetical protein